MTGFSKAAVSYAAELAHLIAENVGLASSVVSDEEAELATWLESAVRDGRAEPLSEFLRLCGRAGSPVYSTAQSLLRSVGSLFGEGEEARILFGIPLFISADAEFQLSQIEARQKIERELELAKDLPFMSVRLCAYPVNRTRVEQLSPIDLSAVGKDLRLYADSKLLRSVQLGHGPDYLIWLGVFKLNGRNPDDFFALNPGEAWVDWHSKSKTWLNQELSHNSVSKLELLPPFRIQSALSTSRLFQLKTEWLSAKQEADADTFSYHRTGALLKWTLYNSQTLQQVEGEAWLPDEATALIRDSIRSFARKHGMDVARELTGQH